MGETGASHWCVQIEGNMDCGAVQVVERVGGAACASAEERDKGRLTNDGRLMTFLRGCKFSLEKTKRKLDMYFTMRAAIPEFFSNRDVNRKELQDILSKVALHDSKSCQVRAFKRAGAYCPRAFQRARAYSPRNFKGARAYSPRALQRARAYHPRALKRARAYHSRALKRARAYHLRDFQRPIAYSPRDFKRARAHPKAFKRARA
uniref:Uncharacterized protein n=1 Tax=Timema bartmani TaxID=61472 RepID=A0A7R9EQQ7_9NEOP|nr:unnamed protein product [Timema bartmani]